MNKLIALRRLRQEGFQTEAFEDDFIMDVPEELIRCFSPRKALKYCEKKFREAAQTRISLRKTEEIYMSKKYYPIEDAVNNVSQKFKLGLKDANEMDEEEFNNVEEYILKYVKFVSHPDYAQLIPQSLETGEYIL